MGKIRVVIADDHAIMRVGIRNILARSSEIHVVGEASNGVEAIELVKDLTPDVLILDMEMPVMDGVEVARRLKANHAPVRILVLSAYDDRQYILEMLEMGASGYLIKDEAPEVIVDAVQSIAAGQKGWISRKAAVRVQRRDLIKPGSELMDESDVEKKIKPDLSDDDDKPDKKVNKDIPE